MTSFFRVLICVLLIFPLAACEGEECREPKKAEDIEKRIAEKIDELMDTADAYDNQRERITKLSDGRKKDRLNLTRMREKARDKSIDELLKKNPQKQALRKIVSDAKTKMMPINYRIVETVELARPMFTSEQRNKIRVKIVKAPDEFEISFLARRGIDVFLFQLDTTDEQSAKIWKQLESTTGDVNVLLKSQHKITTRLMDEWVKKDASKTVILAEVDNSANLFTSFIQTLTDQAVDVMAVFNAAQRLKINERLVRGKSCEAP